MPGFFRARKIQRSKQAQHTSQNQNEKICQQSTFLTFIIYSSLSLSLFCFVLFLGQGSVRSFFASFWCVVSLPLFWGDEEYYSPKRNPSVSLFPCTHASSPRLLTKKTPISLSLSLVRSVVYPFLVFSGRYIYSHILLLLSLFGDPRERVRVEKSSHRGDDPFF